jgi:hypothetical protein
MSSENLHAPRERLSKKALTLHHAIVSLMEELDAIDWYRQRSDDAEDEALKGLLLHNMREEMEHASMLIEYIRRADSDFNRFLKTYLFTKDPILEIEDRATESEVVGDAGKIKRHERSEGAPEVGFTVGPLKGN